MLIEQIFIFLKNTKLISDILLRKNFDMIISLEEYYTVVTI